MHAEKRISVAELLKPLHDYINEYVLRIGEIAKEARMHVGEDVLYPWTDEESLESDIAQEQVIDLPEELPVAPRKRAAISYPDSAQLCACSSDSASLAMPAPCEACKETCSGPGPKGCGEQCSCGPNCACGPGKKTEGNK